MCLCRPLCRVVLWTLAVKTTMPTVLRIIPVISMTTVLSMMSHQVVVVHSELHQACKFTISACEERRRTGERGRGRKGERGCLHGSSLLLMHVYYLSFNLSQNSGLLWYMHHRCEPYTLAMLCKFYLATWYHVSNHKSWIQLPDCKTSCSRWAYLPFECFLQV